MSLSRSCKLEIVGNRCERKEYFLPKLIIAGDLLKGRREPL